MIVDELEFGVSNKQHTVKAVHGNVGTGMSVSYKRPTRKLLVEDHDT